MTSKHNWLILSKAAEVLEVHPNTLRRWADDGRIPVMLTPGGHRRFAASDIEQFAEKRKRIQAPSGAEQIWAQQAVSLTRQELAMRRNASWLMAFDAEDRERKRRLGQRLIGVMLQFISTGDEAEGLLEEAEAIGRAHAHNAISMRLSLTEALRAAMFFRDVVVEAAVQLPETARVKPEANTRLLRRINKLLNAVQLAMVAEYEVSKHAQS